MANLHVEFGSANLLAVGQVGFEQLHVFVLRVLGVAAVQAGKS